jgi:hypothetical protein
MGVLITMADPTPGMIDAANHGGTYLWPADQRTYPRVQIITVAELLAGKRPKMPFLDSPYPTAEKPAARGLEQMVLGADAGAAAL